MFFAGPGSAGRVRMFGLWRRRRTKPAVILAEFHVQGSFFNFMSYLVTASFFSQLYSSEFSLTCTGFSAWSSVCRAWGGV